MFFKHVPPLLLTSLADFFTNDNMTFRTHWMLLFCLLLHQKLYLFQPQFDLPRVLMVASPQNFWKTSFHQWWPSGPPPLTFLYNLPEGWRSPFSKHEGQNETRLLEMVFSASWSTSSIATNADVENSLCSGELPPSPFQGEAEFRPTHHQEDLYWQAFYPSAYPIFCCQMHPIRDGF